MNIAFFGTSEFVGSVQHARFLRRLIAAGVLPAVVVTAPDAPAGPGVLAVKSAALEFGIPVLQPAALGGLAQELAKREIELSLVAAYGKILPPEVLAVPKFGSLNVHPSLLPRWRGPTPIQAAILAGDSVTGATIIQMDAEMDHGPIIAKREFPLGELVWTAPALSDALTDLGVELFLEILKPWTLGKIIPEPQHHETATYSRILKKEDGHISWSLPAREIERMTRALQPWPGAYTFWRRGGEDVRLKIEMATVLPAPSKAEPHGTVIQRGDALAVTTGQGLLGIERLRPAGGHSIPGPDFLRGHSAIIAAVLQ